MKLLFLIDLRNLSSLNRFTKKRSLIVTAIGDPLSFRKSVSFMKCKIVKQLNFKDHSNYSQRKWEKIEALCLKLNVEFILTTEKDWIKIENLKNKSSNYCI